MLSRQQPPGPVLGRWPRSRRRGAGLSNRTASPARQRSRRRRWRWPGGAGDRGGGPGHRPAAGGSEDRRSRCRDIAQGARNRTASRSRRRDWRWRIELASTVADGSRLRATRVRDRCDEGRLRVSSTARRDACPVSTTSTAGLRRWHPFRRTSTSAVDGDATDAEQARRAPAVKCTACEDVAEVCDQRTGCAAAAFDGARVVDGNDGR